MSLTFLLATVTACLSFTICEMQIFLPFRQWTAKQNCFLGKLVSCAYCLGHWIAFILVALYHPRLFDTWWLMDYFFTAIIIAWISAFQWIIMCCLMERAGK